MSSPDLSTLEARITYAAKVIQELRSEDETFNDAYYAMSVNGVGLCGMLDEAKRRITWRDKQRLELIESLAQDVCTIDGAELDSRPHYRYLAQRLVDDYRWRKDAS